MQFLLPATPHLVELPLCQHEVLHSGSCFMVSSHANPEKDWHSLKTEVSLLNVETAVLCQILNASILLNYFPFFPYDTVL
jgi:hypothetical protein